MKYEANAGPPKGDHPIDRAINELPLPQYPIAPPVATGSVDTVEFQHYAHLYRRYQDDDTYKGLVKFLDTWGAQQREAGRAEIRCGSESIGQRLRNALKRAEKAEARVAELEREKVAPSCDCHSCQPITMENNRMILCATCGNKRCPHANDHRNACTGSNEPGQAGSAYE